VAVTVLVAVSITETVLLYTFVTYTFFPSGVIATPFAPLCTGIVAVTVFVAASITETVLLPLFATYTFVSAGLTATPTG